MQLDDIAEQIDQMIALAHADLRHGLRPELYPKSRADAAERLAALTARVHHDLEIMAYPKDPWVVSKTHASGAHVYDVVVVGGGQCGLTVAHALWKERVRNVLVVDKAPRGLEGPWVTYSRMWTLRSPKHVTGPDLGMPSLAPRSWFEAIFGPEGWAHLDKWPRQAWHAYLQWFRDALALPVRNDAEVTGFGLDEGILRLELSGGDAIYARKAVLATGLEGIGDWYVPPVVSDALTPAHYTMCTDDVDSLDWRGKSIALLGAGATGWDRAGDLLELGAASVEIYMRRPRILTANVFRYLEKAGYLRHICLNSMPDADRWRWIQTVFTYGQPPTQDGVDRCAAFENFTLHPGASWANIETTPEGILVTGTDGSNKTFDHLFIGCGFSMNPNDRGELAPFASNIMTWNGVYTPPEEYRDDWLITYPYLRPDMRFTERTPGATPELDHIFCFNYGATVSNGHSGASLSGLLYGIQPLIQGLTYALWMEDEAVHFRIARQWNEVDTDPAPLARNILKDNA